MEAERAALELNRKLRMDGCLRTVKAACYVESKNTLQGSPRGKRGRRGSTESRGSSVESRPDNRAENSAENSPTMEPVTERGGRVPLLNPRLEGGCHQKRPSNTWVNIYETFDPNPDDGVPAEVTLRLSLTLILTLTLNCRSRNLSLGRIWSTRP